MLPQITQTEGLIFKATLRGNSPGDETLSAMIRKMKTELASVQLFRGTP